MKKLSSVAIDDLTNKAFASLSANDLFSDNEIDYLASACETVPKEIIEIGDVGEKNRLAVGRFMVDKKGELPAYCNDPLGKRVVDILSSGKCGEFFKEVMGGDYFIRRCQANMMMEGGFIGKHIDTYSNFDYRYSVVIQFGQSYDGGTFFVDFEGDIKKVKTSFADMIINRCEIPHGVEPVTAGKRMSLVFFLSTSSLDMKNLENNQI